MYKIIILISGMLLTSCSPTQLGTPRMPTTADIPARIQRTPLPEAAKMSTSATSPISPPIPENTRLPTEAPKNKSTELPKNQGKISQRAIDDLARRLQVNPTAIQLVKISPDEFPASNLGCPSDSGKFLPIPAIVSGQTIVLEYQNARYIYHARATEVVFCGEG